MARLLLVLLLTACVDGTPYEPRDTEIEVDLICWLRVNGQIQRDCNCDGLPNESPDQLANDCSTNP